jgi:transcriptional regulator with XRE-family HTH domain
MNDWQRQFALGAQIKEFRIERGLTQQQLATAVGLERTSITNIEGGNQRVAVDMLYAIGAALGYQVTVGFEALAGWQPGTRGQRQPDADDVERVAPWPDFAGQPIHVGAVLRHPSGEQGTVVFLAAALDPGDQWRIDYGAAGVSRLCLQIGDKGRAVVVAGPVNVNQSEKAETP